MKRQISPFPFYIFNTLILALGLISCGSNDKAGYTVQKDGGVTHWNGGAFAPSSIVNGADGATFVQLAIDFGKDKAHAFYIDKIIEGAAPATFEALPGEYSRDKNHGYAREVAISDDPSHMSTIEEQGVIYARDSHQVYGDTTIVPGADPATFKIVFMSGTQFLTYDKNHVYYANRILEGADGGSFQRASDYNFKDKNQAWGSGLDEHHSETWRPIPSADVATFVSAGPNYAKDKRQVYLGDQVVEGADPDSFKETHALMAKDKNGNYNGGNRVQ